MITNHVIDFLRFFGQQFSLVRKKWLYALQIDISADYTNNTAISASFYCLNLEAARKFSLVKTPRYGKMATVYLTTRTLLMLC